MSRKVVLVALCAAVWGVVAWPLSAQPLQNMAEVRISFSDTIKRVSPAVVNIFSKKVVQAKALNPFLSDPLFSFFFGQAPNTPYKERVEQSLGSGVIVSPDGVMVTNYHVVEDSSELKVVFADGREANVRFLNADEKMDIAVFKIETDVTPVPYLPFANSDSIEVGDVVLAVGNPYGVGQSVSMGIVSAVGRSTAETGPYQNFIQTDAAINPGNSGGALVDSTGRLVGVNTAIFTKSGGSQGIGFAVPANTVQAIVQQIVETGKVVRPWLGATGQNLTVALAENLGLDTPQGVLISEIANGSPAQQGGLQVGDIIVKIDDVPVDNINDMNGRLYMAKVGSQSEFTVWREGREQVLYIPMRGLPERKAEDQKRLEGRHPLNFAVVEQLSPALNVELGFAPDRRGVVVLQSPQTSLFMLDIRPGDVILQVNRTNIESLPELEQALAKRPRAWELVFERRGRVYKVLVQ